MKTLLLKTAAITSSVLLSAGFIWYRTGGVERLHQKSQISMLASCMRGISSPQKETPETPLPESAAPPELQESKSIATPAAQIAPILPGSNASAATVPPVQILALQATGAFEPASNLVLPTLENSNGSPAPLIIPPDPEPPVTISCAAPVFAFKPSKAQLQVVSNVAGPQVASQGLFKTTSTGLVTLTEVNPTAPNYNLATGVPAISTTLHPNAAARP